MNKNVKNTGRIEELDIFKGIGMIMVVAFHFLDYASDSLADIAPYINSALIMSLFFLVSGYTWKPGKTAWQLVRKRIPPMLFMFFVCTVVITLLFYGVLAIKGLAEEEDLGTSLWWALAGKGMVDILQPGVYEDTLLMIPAGVYWFLRQMALTGLIYYLLVNTAMKKNLYFILITGVLFGLSALMCFFCPQMPWDFQISPALAGCMLVGAWCGQKRLIERLKGKLFHPAVIVAAVLLMAGLVLISIQFPAGDGLGRGYFSSEIENGPDVLTGLLALLVAVLPVGWILVMIGRTKWLKRPLRWMGKHSLGIYLIHMFIGMSVMVLAGMDKVIFDEEVVPYQGVKAVGVFLISLVLSSCLAPFIEKILGRSTK